MAPDTGVLPFPPSTSLPADPADRLARRIAGRGAKVGIIGMGYVGLPLAAAVVGAGHTVLGLDVDAAKVRVLNAGGSTIGHVGPDAVERLRATGRFEATGDFRRLRDCDVIVACVPTPLTRNREPDLSYVEATARDVAASLRPGQLVVLESTTYPGTTAGLVRPILETTGLANDADFFLAYSPEREDPGNPRHSAATVPRVVGAEGPRALRLAEAFYASVAPATVPVSSSAVAEAVKLTENVFRAVNIALVNELKVVLDAMGLDVWEVIAAASTKPFGYMPFHPGPGLGGHCIPIDPFYLTWKAREFGVCTRFIELAGEVNTRMPHWVVERLALALDSRTGRGLNGARILLLGMAYKPNVDDVRESPSLRLTEIIEARGARVDYHDPHVPEVPRTREHPGLAGRRSVPLDMTPCHSTWDRGTLDPGAVASYDAVLIATDHDAVDHAGIAAAARLVVDTRNALGRLGIVAAHVVKA